MVSWWVVALVVFGGSFVLGVIAGYVGSWMINRAVTQEVRRWSS